MNTHYAHTLGRNRYAYLTAGRNWYVISKSSLQQVDQNFEVMHCHCSNDIICKYFVYFYLTLLYQMRKFRSFVINVSLVPVTVPEEGDSLRNVVHLILRILCRASVILLISVVVYE
jgi:hypothetical protein